MQQLILIFIVYYFVLSRDYEIEFLKKNFFAAPLFQAMVLYPISIFLMLIHYYEFGYQGQMNWFLYICLMALSICLLFVLFDLIRNWIKIRYTEMYYNNHFFILTVFYAITFITMFVLATIVSDFEEFSFNYGFSQYLHGAYIILAIPLLKIGLYMDQTIEHKYTLNPWISLYERIWIVYFILNPIYWLIPLPWLIRGIILLLNKRKPLYKRFFIDVMSNLFMIVVVLYYLMVLYYGDGIPNYI